MSLLADAVLCAAALGGVLATRAWARRRRRYVRLRLLPYRTDRASVAALVASLEGLHKRLLARWWRRLLLGQPSVALEVAVATAGRATRVGAKGEGAGGGDRPQAWLSVTCPRTLSETVAAALRTAYPNLRLVTGGDGPALPTRLLRLKKRESFLRRLHVLADGEQGEPLVDRLLRAMAANAGASVVQLALTPAPACYDRWAGHLIGRERAQARGRAPGADAEGEPAFRAPRGRPALAAPSGSRRGALFFGDIRVLAPTRGACEQIASELRAEGAENQLVERGTVARQRLGRIYDRRIRRGEGNPIPSWRRGVYASSELATLWQLPSVGFAAVPVQRSSVPLVPAPPAIMRPAGGEGLLRDMLGPVTLHRSVRWQNVAVPGAVGQGKTSFLVATVREDLRRARCAVILLDPKGDAADAAISVVPRDRRCTLLDLARPTCGFNPLAVDAPVDAIADSVVGALRQLFSESDIRASSDRYLRNAIIAVLAAERRASLWDAARLLSVTADGRSYRRRVGARVRELPEYKEVADFLGDELPTQLEEARSTTTAKLDAPANKLARVLNSAAIKRVLRNDSLALDLDRIIAGAEVLIVRGALGQMGAGNTAVVMQLLTGMLDAALARQQDFVPAAERVTVALKIDEAPLVINRGFAATMALKRSAGLETVACWQADAQWEEPALREQLDALFAHRVCFATTSPLEARASASLMMADYTDQVRPGMTDVAALGHPDVRLYLPRHVAVVSWTTPDGRQPPFVARTLPLTIDDDRIAYHAAAQAARGGRYQDQIGQPHWEQGPLLPAPVWRSVAGGSGVGDRSGAADRPVPAPADGVGRYDELAQLDQAVSVRWSTAPARRGLSELEQEDVPLLEWMAERGYALTSQIHRRWNPSRAATTTQRQLKRLWDGGWLDRFQLYRADGGGVPMCYALTYAARRAIEPGEGQAPQRADHAPGPLSSNRRPTSAAIVRAARRGARVTGWVGELERCLGSAVREVLGRQRSAQSPAQRGLRGELAPQTPGDLVLPAGRRAHGFLHTRPDGRRVEVQAFEPIRPDATVVVSLAADSGPMPTHLMVALEPGPVCRRRVLELERYDHMISGWCVRRRRYVEHGPPLVVFVCKDDRAARELCRLADAVLTACWAYAGEDPTQWLYVGRRQMLFAAERDAYEGRLTAYGVPAAPPAVRGAGSSGVADPAAAGGRFSGFVPDRREIIAAELLAVTARG